MQEGELDFIVDNALDAFWSNIVADCPNVESGDLPPEIVMELQESATKAVKAWLEYNI